MAPETITIIGVGVALAALIVGAPAPKSGLIAWKTESTGWKPA
jgi:hypothetical protein